MGPLPVIALSLLSDKLSKHGTDAVEWAAQQVKEWYKKRPTEKIKDNAHVDILQLDKALSEGDLDTVMAKFAESRDYVERRRPGGLSERPQGDGGPLG